MNIIFTSNEASLSYARREIGRAFGVHEIKILGPGVALCDLPGDFSSIAREFVKRPIVFVRHIFPALFALPANDPPLTALDAIENALDIRRSYSVQARALEGEMPVRELSSALQERGFRLDIRAPEQAVSLYRTRDALYIGVSDARDNLSDWNGGMMHFSQAGLISRAECKLLEAFHVFDIALRPGNLILDLGAAPGGWSNALAARGARVVAVDPAALDARLDGHPAIEHIPATAQAFMLADERQFDFIACDMKMDALQALDLLFTLRPRLAPGAPGILSTLKLPKRDADAAANAALGMIRRRGELLSARQLFHNRSEITVWFR